MGAMKRTVRYLTRKWKKSILLFAIFLVVGTLVISGISIQSASEQAATNLRRSFGGGFVMKEDHSVQSKFERRDVGNGSYAMVYTGESLTKEIADKVASVPGVSGYNAENIGPANLKTMEGDYLELKSIEGSMFANEPVLSKQANIYGYTNTQEADMFTGGSIELIEGRQITPKDQNAVLIHKELAEKNGLKLGDQFIIAMNSQITGGDEEGGKLKETVTIVGIFDSKVSQQVSVFSTPGELLENTVLMDVETSVKLLSWSSAGYYKVNYRVNDPAELNNIMQEVKKLNSIDWSCYSISTDNKTYEVATTPLDNLSGLITTLIIIITIIGVAVLMQHMAEVFIIAILSFGISFFTSSAVAQGLGNTLLGDTSQSSTPQNTQLEEDGSFGYTLPETPMNVDTATELSVTVVPQTFLWVFGIGGLLTVVAVLAASVPLFRLKPKQLLAKMS